VANLTLPTLASFFADQPFSPLSTAWVGFFNALATSGTSASASGTAAAGTATYSLEVEGTLGIASDQAPKTYVVADFTPSMLRVDLKQAPVGANLVVTLSYYPTPGAPTLVATFTVGSGLLFATATSAVAVPLGAFWEVDILGVGTTFPGSGLTVTVQ
jgi:hypothetical protein